MTTHRFLVALSVLLALIALCTVGVASSSGGVTQWNSVTEDVSDSFSVDIHMDEPREVEFRVSSGLPYEWTWTVNDDEIEDADGESSNFVFAFDEYGSYTVCALGEEGNEPAASACWNVTVSLVIGAENDVQDLEGLEDYTLRFSQRPERIISMAPSCTEILFAVGAGDRVVGVTDYCDYPPEALELETIGGYSTPSLEKIVAFEPDLIVGAHGNPNDVVYRLIELGYPVYGQNPEDIDEILTQIQIMGAITGCTDDSASLAQDLSERLEPIKEATESLEEAQRPRVFYNIGEFFTAGDGTFINEVIRLAGGTNIAAGTTGYYTMNLEELVDKNPHVIICDSGMGTMEAAKEGIMGDPRLQIVDAVNNSWVYVIDGDIISRPGPRVIDAVEIVYDDYGDFFAAAEADENDNGEYPGSGGSSAKVTPPPPAMPAPATPTVTKASRNIPFLQAGEEVAMIFEDMDVALIALEAADGNVSDLNVAVERVEKSAEIPEPSGIAYAYLDIEIDHEETADLDGRIECKVLKSWIANNAIDETTIRLYRYNNDGGGWQALATSKSREENDFVYFEAETLQFSLFVITGEKAVAVTPPVTPVSAPLVILDQIAAVGVGEPLTVTGTSNRKDGFAIVVTVTGPVELPPQTVAIANGGAFEATFDTSTAAAAGGIYTVKADDGEGHIDEATVTIGAASATSAPESAASTTSEVPGFEAILAVVAVLMVRRLRRRNGRF